MIRLWYKDGTFKDVNTWEAWEYRSDPYMIREENLVAQNAAAGAKAGFDPVITGSDHHTP